MEKALEQFAIISGSLGLLIAALSGITRLLGFHYLLGLESMTVLVGAIALMVASCTVQLHLLRSR